ncbi:MAG: outer membrane protein assembly factor BamE domain-containing protein [Planctomycetota bacterium]|jgi:outer membrane protein assembly factor BamE (lipoprotein component of BamABCDE complex)
MKRLTPLLVFILLIAPGCFFSRSKSEAAIDPVKVGQIRVGESTKEDVLRILGAPTDIIFSNRQHDPLHVFAYEYTYTVNKSTGFTIILVTFLNSDRKRDHVVIFFDEEGIVSAIGTRFEAEDATYKFPFGD